MDSGAFSLPIAATPTLPLPEASLASVALKEPCVIKADDQDETSPRRVNQIRLF